MCLWMYCVLNECDDLVLFGCVCCWILCCVCCLCCLCVCVWMMFWLMMMFLVLVMWCVFGWCIVGVYCVWMMMCNVWWYDVVGMCVVGVWWDVRMWWTGAGASAAASDKANATASDVELVKLLMSDESENLLKIWYMVCWKCEVWGDLCWWWIGWRRARGERRGFVRDLNYVGTKGDWWWVCWFYVL